MTTPGIFGDIGVEDFIINGSSRLVDIMGAVNDCIIEVTMEGASTVTIIVTDPLRTVLNSGAINQGDTLTFDDLSFTYVQLAKASDQLQFTFEATGVYQLRGQMGVTATTTTTDITSFAQMLVSEVPGLKFVGAPVQTYYPIACARGSSTDVNEDSWTCLQRIANTAAWRCWEYAGTIYFGPDPYWLQQPSTATFQEFTSSIAEMDVDWDYGQPMGNITATAFIGLIEYRPGQVVTVNDMGPASGIWLVDDIQRDLYSPLATVTLTIPLTPAEIALTEEESYAADTSTSSSTTATTVSGGTPTTTSPQNGYPVVTVSASPNPARIKESFTVSCNVSGQGVGVTPTGTVSFVRNGRVMENGAAVELHHGSCSLTEHDGLANAGPNHIVCFYNPSSTAKWQANDNSAAPLLFTVVT